MPKSLIADPSLIEIIGPPCPKCHGPMTLTAVVLMQDGREMRTFDCSLCNCTEKIIV
jgi:hypothetical protein